MKTTRLAALFAALVLTAPLGTTEAIARSSSSSPAPAPARAPSPPPAPRISAPAPAARPAPAPAPAPATVTPAPAPKAAFVPPSLTTSPTAPKAPAAPTFGGSDRTNALRAQQNRPADPPTPSVPTTAPPPVRADSGKSGIATNDATTRGQPSTRERDLAEQNARLRSRLANSRAENRYNRDQREADLRARFSVPMYAPPTGITMGHYSAFFMGMMLSNALSANERANWAYNHRNEMDPSVYARMQQDADVRARLAALEQQGARRDPAYVPPMLADNADLMYDKAAVAEAQSPSTSSAETARLSRAPSVRHMELKKSDPDSDTGWAMWAMIILLLGGLVAGGWYWMTREVKGTQ